MDTKITVTLDTGQAQRQLKTLESSAEKSAGRVSDRVRKTIRSGARALGTGVGIGTGVAAVRGAVQSGAGDVFGEAFGLIGEQITDFLFGDLAAEARGKKLAREDAIRLFGLQAGREGQIPQAAVEYLEQQSQFRIDQATGERLFNTDPRFSGPGIDDIFARLRDLLIDAADRVAKGIADYIF